MANYQLVLDQSTSGTKLLLLLSDGKIVKRYDKKHQQIYPKVGWVEHDPLEIWKNVEALLSEALRDNKLEPSDITTLSITNQRETIVAWDKTTDKPLYNAIVWQCNRSAEICEELNVQGYQEIINKKTGLRIDPYFSGTKIKWLRDEIPGIAEKSGTGELAIGTIDSWLIWKLTQGTVFSTDASNACRTLLYNINTYSWDDELIQLFGINRADLPEIRKAEDTFGFYKGIAIRGVMADSQAALYGEQCFESGDVKITMGTGCSIMMQVDQKNQIRDDRILTTLAWENSAQTSFALEGIIRSCGDSLNWFSENIAKLDDITTIFNEVLGDDNISNVIFIPAIQGLGAPYWNNEATAAFLGMNRTTTQRELLRSVLESIIFQIKSVLDVMEEISDSSIKRILVDGGMVKNRLLMGTMATLLNREIIISEIEEFSGMGVAILANPKIIQKKFKQEHFLPNSDKSSIYTRYELWKNKIETFCQ